jgi:hypothetical protein
MFKAGVRLENPSYRIDDRDYRFQYRIASKEFPSPFPLEFFLIPPLLLLSPSFASFRSCRTFLALGILAGHCVDGLS